MKERVFYYTDEFSEVLKSDTVPKKITRSYPYIPKSKVWKIKRFIAYRLIATPLAFLYSKIYLRQSVKNKKLLGAAGEHGFFLYINHTQEIGDAVMPHVAIFPRSAYTVVHPSNLSLPAVGRFTPLLGALPTPDSLSGLRPFSEAIAKRHGENSVIVIYPEAHVWPYYTGIRNFPSTAMRYPVELSSPSFTMTNVYKKSKWIKRPRIISYIDGPFYPDESLSKKEAAEKLRDEIYDKMKERAAESDCEYVKYVQEKG